MSEMVERVARAIATADEQNGAAPYEALEQMGKHVMGPLFDRARAAIEAMRIPTDAMVEAGWAESHDENAAGTWRDMIDEALK